MRKVIGAVNMTVDGFCDHTVILQTTFFRNQRDETGPVIFYCVLIHIRLIAD